MKRDPNSKIVKKTITINLSKENVVHCSIYSIFRALKKCRHIERKVVFVSMENVNIRSDALYFFLK